MLQLSWSSALCRPPINIKRSRKFSRPLLRLGGADVHDPFAEELRRVIREEVARQLAEAQRADELLDQKTSPIGARRHIKLARELIEQGDSRAAQAGRKYLVERGAILEVLGNTQRDEEAACEAESLLADELGLELRE